MSLGLAYLHLFFEILFRFMQIYFIKPNYPERAGITNIRGKGDILHIATYLGSDCSGGNFTNSAGSYLIDEITWP